MDRLGGHSYVLAAGTGLHVNCGWISAGGNFNLRIINYEIIYIIVRYYVSYYLLIFLAC